MSPLAEFWATRPRYEHDDEAPHGGDAASSRGPLLPAKIPSKEDGENREQRRRDDEEPGKEGRECRHAGAPGQNRERRTGSVKKGKKEAGAAGDEAGKGRGVL